MTLDHIIATQSLIEELLSKDTKSRNVSIKGYNLAIEIINGDNNPPDCIILIHDDTIDLPGFNILSALFLNYLISDGYIDDYDQVLTKVETWDYCKDFNLHDLPEPTIYPQRIESEGWYLTQITLETWN